MKKLIFLISILIILIPSLSYAKVAPKKIVVKPKIVKIVKKPIFKKIEGIKFDATSSSILLPISFNYPLYVPPIILPKYDSSNDASDLKKQKTSQAQEKYKESMQKQAEIIKQSGYNINKGCIPSLTNICWGS